LLELNKATRVIGAVIAAFNQFEWAYRNVGFFFFGKDAS
jgi:hypothetical protein